ncbi:hypothetical protein SISNIDRAFT_461238 [Sistotremastrum niveocremeum HHB9708]|uniref:CUE domain-containing protein n=2 Tax=Sistotremastraceae TaxID=3402574 RepID=A0A164MV34_9AGAM|nr:hypothetical protein SISNIDRAFT_461238 [Sistotremastrum niveocremeum HHB9708]KZT37786.1 hypothetical protein SISSUDRAFT_1047989 [Sistotremastrum suecicum HHB10207 ss-3]
MTEIVNVVVAFAVIALVVRWATKSRSDAAPGRPRSPATILGFRPQRVTDEMVTSVHSMFPNIPEPNIRYDLLRSGNVQVTSNKILEKGFLDAPPAAYFELYPPPATSATSATDLPSNPNSRSAAAHTNATASSSKTSAATTLISRYNLHSRLSSSTPGTEGEDLSNAPSVDVKGSSKGVWETEAEKREASLRERKAKMVLAARKRLLEQEERERKGKGVAA